MINEEEKVMISNVQYKSLAVNKPSKPEVIEYYTCSICEQCYYEGGNTKLSSSILWWSDYTILGILHITIDL
jgi:hypothetical protein